MASIRCDLRASHKGTGTHNAAMDTSPSMRSKITCCQIATKSPHALNQPKIHNIPGAPVHISLKQVLQLCLELQHYIVQQFNTQLNTIEVEHHATLVCMCVDDVIIMKVMVDGGSGVDVLSKHLCIRLKLPILQ